MNAKLSSSFKNAKSRFKKDFYAEISDLKEKKFSWVFLLIFRVGFLRVLWVGFFVPSLIFSYMFLSFCHRNMVFANPDTIYTLPSIPSHEFITKFMYGGINRPFLFSYIFLTLSTFPSAFSWVSFCLFPGFLAIFMVCQRKKHKTMLNTSM